MVRLNLKKRRAKVILGQMVEVRKQLFDCLRRDDFIDVYLNKLQELDYYILFCDACESIYIELFYDWVEKNNLSSIFKQ